MSSFPYQTLRPVLAAVALVWVLSAAPGEALEPRATTEVMAVVGSEVILSAGRIHGLAVASRVTLLREAEPIVHPLTGEVLGVPQEPVGTVHITEVDERQSRGGLVKKYSEPMQGDLAEYVPVVPEAAPDPVVHDVMREMQSLRETVERVSHRDDDMRSYPAFARKVWDEVSAMRSYLSSLDERLIELEEQQSEDHFRLTSVLHGEYRPEDLKEFTIRYSPDTQVRLRAAGKTLVIDVIADSLRITEDMSAPVAMVEPAETTDSGPGLLGLFSFGGDDDEENYEEMMAVAAPEDEAATPWYESPYHLAAGMGLVLALAIMVGLVIKRRYNDVMDGLEDFDDEYEGYLEDDEDDEDEDDEDEEQGR